MYKGFPIRNHLKYFLFWLLYFQVARIVFIIWNVFSFEEKEPFYEYLKAFWHGLPLDLSTSAYLTIIPVLVSFLVTLLKLDANKFLRYYTILFLVLSSILIGIDMQLYTFWGYRIDATPLFYMKTPGVVLKSLSFTDLFNPLLVAVILSIAFSRFYPRFLPPVFPKRTAFSLIMHIAFIALLFLPIRGGFDVAPMNVGRAYFSKSTFLNHAAINPIWNFLFSITEASVHKPSVHNISEKDADHFLIDMKKELRNDSSLLKSTTPNVLFIILESFTAKFLDEQRKGRSATPNLLKLAEEGIYFENIYASGDRTDKGLVSILSGYPAQPSSSIMKYPSKTEKIPNLINEFENRNYHTSFYYGGVIDFANMRSYIRQSGVDIIVEKSDFPDETYGEKWGVYDHIVMDTLLKDLQKMPQPFMSTMLTLSSHEPFDVPVPDYFEIENRTDEFVNSAMYTDESLGRFISGLKESNIWDNLIIVITSDHGHRLPGNDVLEDSRRFRIPMIWTGGAIALSDTVNTWASQTDIAATLMGQLGWKNEQFQFSRDIFKNEMGPVYYSFNNGYSVISEEGQWVYDRLDQEPRQIGETSSTELLTWGNYFYESLMYDFDGR